MILNDIYKYLTADAALNAALQSASGDSKIYPNYARITSRLPYIVYRSLNPGGASDEVLSSEAASFVITSETYAKTVEISEILSALLDAPQQEIPGEKYAIHYAKQTGGNDFTDELGRHARALNFNFKFSKRPLKERGV